MERAAKFAKTIRNNWKKSVVGVIALYYGGATLKEKYEINVLMRAACKEAALYGDALIPMERNPTMVTVILNPVANKRTAKRDFEKYCEPLLHLAGLQLNVIQTASEGNAKDIVESLHGTEAIIVAGGDGTLSETVTGLLRRNDDANQFPLGVIPLGRTNTFGNSLFPGGKGADKVKQLIEACMAIIKGNTDWKDAMKIEPISTEGDTPSRPIYAVSSIEYGAFRDALAKKDKYWIYGPLRDYATYIFNGYKNSLTWECNGTIKYTPPCAGCNNCVVQKKREVRKVWSLFMSNTIAAQESKQLLDNPECSKTQELCYKVSDFRIQTENKNGMPVLNVMLGKNGYTYTEFVAEGWNRLKNMRKNTFVIPARTVELLPLESEKEVMIEIDREEFEVKPVKVTLLPKIIKLFCSPQVQVNG
ncbi:acylglycerol kinase, mitochondrial [Amyelois transitella]|uniref:acylglycerol kinase, mitochondrial n=1 Tax=Amyelois transitella TaxID=680683 RepID=UPI00067DA2FF|nr:acylglycerol kinase, mitochondrial [Amyelois transitella]